ncbi:MAG: PD40 domain-containing protein [Anaerolineales bacterium]|nr:PD40 domain-containing protein [Anaerolineales bacterium]
MLSDHPAGSLSFRKRPRFRLPCSLLALAGIILLFFLIPATGIDLENYPLLSEAGTSLPRPVTFTPPPTPTHVHGGRIVYTCTRDEFNQLCLINADGTQPVRLSQYNRHDYYPVFVPNSDHILFASNRMGRFDLYLMLPEEARLFQLTDNIGNAFSPDLSPDGEQVVFVNRPAEGPASIWMMDRTGENPALFYSGPNTIVAVNWSPDGRRLAFAMAVDQPNAYEIFLLDLNAETLSPQRLSYGLDGIGGSLDWSPDAEKLLIYAGPVGNKSIYQIETASGAITQLTDDGGNNAAASYSPDGRQIAFNSTRNNDQADIYIMDADGSNLRRLTYHPEPDWQPRWEP